TSVHEDWPMPGNAAYCLSKGGMRMLTRTAGVELAPHNILVVGVGPGAVATPINLSTMQDPAKMAKLDAAIPLGRMAQPQEIGSVVGMLAYGGGSYLTATTVFADGGLMQSSPGLERSTSMPSNYDVIIIGSGAGGGTLARSVAATRKRILILERGDWLKREALNWDPKSVFVDNRYISKDTWYGCDGKPFQPQ